MSLYMVSASASMLAASTDIAGCRMRLLKSSSDSVRSAEVKLRSTPFCVATCKVTLVSVVSWADSVAPVRTVYWFGRRIFSESPVLAPDLAKLSSYCRLIEEMNAAFWWRMRSASRVTAVGVNRVLGMCGPLFDGVAQPLRLPGGHKGRRYGVSVCGVARFAAAPTPRPTACRRDRSSPAWHGLWRPA